MEIHTVTHTHTHTHLPAAPAIITPDGDVLTTVPPGGFKYFRTECPTYNARVLIELTDINGTSYLYASATEDNPGPLTASTISNETEGVVRRTLTLTIPRGSNVSLVHADQPTKHDIPVSSY